MSQPFIPSHPDWKAPASDGEVLIWPEPARLLSETRENLSRLSGAEDVRIQNAPLTELRRAMRRFIGHVDDARPIIASGHQAELYHAGVWAKDVLIDRAAAKIDGAAYHFAVDTDSPKHLQVRWPRFSEPITDDPALTAAAWVGQLAPPTPAHLTALESSARRDFASFGFEPPVFDFLASLKKLSLESDNLAAMLTNAQHALDWQLGLRHHALTVSPMLLATPYLVFVHHVLARAVVFAATYNSALAGYRAAEGINSNSRPMPDLFTSEQAVEAPFWLDNLATGARSRPSVFRVDGGWMLPLLDGGEFVFDPSADANDAAAALSKFLTAHNHRLAPRALTLTIFLRMFVADQFVHGIGGARYDNVADRIIASHFGMQPPSFCVTTATMFFPGATDHSRVCLPCIEMQGHRLRHDVLGSRKRELVQAIESMPRGSPQRATAFAEMHRERRSELASSPRISRFEQARRDALTRYEEEVVLYDRELFYAVQSRERLESLIANYSTQFHD